LISSIFCLARKRECGRNRDETDEFDQTIGNMVGDFMKNPDKRREDIGLFAPLSNDTPPCPIETLKIA